MKTQHTPFPWHVTDGVGQRDYIYGASGYPVAQICRIAPKTATGKICWNEMEANAAFICRAVNSHDELLNLVCNILPQSVKINGDESQWVKDARAAILKATGGQS